MDTEPQDRDLASSPPETCTATKRDGKRCGAPPMRGHDVCSLHSARGAEIRAKAVRASADARRAKVEAREEAVERSKLSLTQWFAVVAGENAEAIARKAVASALDGDVRALSIVLERVEGKVADKLVTQAGDPFEMDAAEMAKWLFENTPEHDTVSDSE